MNDHNYYQNNEDLKSEPKTFKVTVDGLDFTIKTDNGVFAKSGVDYATEILLKNAEISQNSCILDVGCGYGIIGVFMAKKYGCKVEMIDVNPRAINLAKDNLELNNLSGDVYLSDCFENVKNKYDFIISNPPIRAGKKVIYRIYEEAKDHLNPGGAFYIVIQKKHGAPSTIEKLESIYENVEIIYKKKGFFVIKSY